MMEDAYSELRSLLWSLLAGLSYLGAILFLVAVYVVLTLPLRRKERARLFLDVLEMGMADGHTPERAIANAAASEDRMLGIRFHELAAYVRGGVPLIESLRKISRLLPPEIVAMLAVGVELGDVRKVLPACRQLLADALSHTRGALNYVAVLGFILLPVLPVVMTITSIFVLPKFMAISEDMDVPLSPFALGVFESRGPLILFSILLMLFVQALVLFYMAGPRGRMIALHSPLGRAVDWLLYCLPWRRNRMKRDFAAMLALALDAGVPEERAVRLAGASTANAHFIQGADRVANALRDGVKLTDALAVLDRAPELRWRVTNARYDRDGFFNSLRGWMQLLDAKAFQQEQSAAHLASTALVILNGLVIGLFIVAVFSFLISIATEAALW